MIAFGPRLGQRGQNWRAVRSDARIRSAASVDSSLVPYSVHAGTVVTQDEPGVWLQLDEGGAVVTIPRLPIRLGSGVGWVTPQDLASGDVTYFQMVIVGREGQQWMPAMGLPRTWR